MNKMCEMKSFEDIYIDLRRSGYSKKQALAETMKIWTNGKFEQQPRWRQEESLRDAKAVLGFRL